MIVSTKVNIFKSSSMANDYWFPIELKIIGLLDILSGVVKVVTKNSYRVFMNKKWLFEKYGTLSI